MSKAYNSDNSVPVESAPSYDELQSLILDLACDSFDWGCPPQEMIERVHNTAARIEYGDN